MKWVDGPRLALLSASSVVGALTLACDAPSAPPDASVGFEPSYCVADLSYLEEPFASSGPYRREPDEMSFGRVEGWNLLTQWTMSPWERSSFTQYWIGDEQPFQMTLRWAQGTVYSGTGDMLVHVYVDGEPVLFDGAFETVIPFTDGIAAHSFSVPAERFPDGLSLLSVHFDMIAGPLTSSRQSAVLGPFTVFRRRTDALTVFEDTPGYRAEPAELRYTTRAWTVPDHREFSVATETPPRGTWRLTLGVQASISAQPCTELNDTVAVVALLDGEPIELHPYGHRIVATLPTGERRVFDVELRDLPVGDGAVHRLSILQIGGLGHPMEDRWGLATAWFDLGRTVVTRAEWE